MGVLISNVTSGSYDNMSDDDVIEVVRDEAPIEIMSSEDEKQDNVDVDNVDVENHFNENIEIVSMNDITAQHQENNEINNKSSVDPLIDSVLDMKVTEDRVTNIPQDLDNTNNITTPYSDDIDVCGNSEINIETNTVDFSQTSSLLCGFNKTSEAESVIRSNSAEDDENINVTT